MRGRSSASQIPSARSGADVNFPASAGQRTLRVLLALLVSGPVALAAQSSGGRIFKSGVELVALNVVATDTSRRFVRDLGADDFIVFEDGVPQHIAFFADGQLPLDLVVLLDTSSSMTDKWSVARRAAVGFIRTLRPGDRGTVVGFSNRSCVLQGLTSEVPELVSAINRAGADGTTALYTAIYVALREYGRPAPKSETRRRALVVLSDGFDTESRVPFEALVDEARRAGLTIYTIALESKFGLGPAFDGAASEARYAMVTLARETGGQAYFAREVRELEGIYGLIADELANQYSLAYAPPAADGAAGLRNIVVRVTSRSDVKVRTRTGYVADKTAASGSDR